MSLAVSITEPPPTARKALGWYFLAKSIASRILELFQYVENTEQRVSLLLTSYP